MCAVIPLRQILKFTLKELYPYFIRCNYFALVPVDGVYSFFLDLTVPHQTRHYKLVSVASTSGADTMMSRYDLLDLSVSPCLPDYMYTTCMYA